MPFIPRIVDNTRPGSFANRMRDRRFRIFVKLAKTLPGPIRILDVGGSPEYWAGRIDQLPVPVSIVTLNLLAMESTDPRVSPVVGDGLDLSRYADNSFDVVYGNSVIEHVETLPNQRRMADEMRRVGVRYFVQTPNRNFPIEPHFLFPGFQFLPVRVRVALLRRLPLGWYGRIEDPVRAEREVRSIRLMSEGEVRSVFPGATIVRERLGGFTKSIMAYAGW